MRDSRLLQNIRPIKMKRKKNKKISRVKNRKRLLVLLIAIVALASASFFVFQKLKNHLNYNIAKTWWGDSLYQNKNKDFSASFLNKNQPDQVDVNYQFRDAGVEMQLLDEKGKTAKFESAKVATAGRKDEITFANVRPGTDLRYQIIENGVKEEMILRDRSAVTKNYTFSLNLKNAEPKKVSQNIYTYYFLKKGTTEYAFHMEKPFMVDAKGIQNDDIQVFIRPDEKIKDKYFVVLKPDKNWLQDEARAFPVTIDPTFVHNAQAQFDTGIYNRTESTNDPRVQTSYHELPADENTVGLWHMNEIADANVADSSKNANNGTATGTTITNGIIGKGRSFNGVDDYVQIPDSAPLNFVSAPFAIEAWVNKSSSFGSTFGRIYDKSQAGSSNGYGLTMNDSQIRMLGSTDLTINYNSALNVWHHIAAVSDGAGTGYIYVNGKLVGSGSYASANAYTGAAQIGKASDASSYFNGLIDEVRISGVARVSEEIRADAGKRPYGIYTSPAIDSGSDNAHWKTINWTELGNQTGDGEILKDSSGLVAQWNFNEAGGTAAANDGGAGSCGGAPASCDFTLNNFASTGSRDAAPSSGWTANSKRWGTGGIMLSSVSPADFLSRADIAGNVLDPGSGDLALEAWIKTNDTSAEIFSNNNSNGTACTNNGYYLGIDSGGFPVFKLDTDGASAGCDADVTGSFKVNDGDYHFLAVSVTRGIGATLYLDGVAIGADSSVSSYASVNVSGNMYVGGSAGELDAVLDSIRVYSRPLSADEILSNYNAGNAEFQTRTGTSSNPSDGTWENWKPITGAETQIVSLDSDKNNWKADYGDPYTKFLLHADGSNGSTAFLDLNSPPKDITANGDAQIKTDQSKFGGSSAYFDGSGDYLYVPDSEDWNFGSGDFTVDAWIKTSAAGTDQVIAANFDYPNNRRSWFLAVSGSYGNKLWLGVSKDGTTASGQYYTVLSNNAVNDGQWHHVAGLRNGTSIYLFVDGVKQTSTNTVSGSLYNRNYFEAGRWTRTAAGYFNGHIDELHVSKGIARWTSNFTSPSSPYNDTTWANQNNESVIKTEGAGSMKITTGALRPDANTVGLWHLDETSGTGAFLKDVSGNGNDGTPTGTTVSDGISDKARNFNGDTDYVSIPDSTSLKPSQITVEAWIRADTITNNDTILGKTTSSSWTDGYGLDLYGNSKLHFWVNAYNNSSKTEATIPTGQWVYVVGTYDQVNTKLYVNGQMISSAAYTTAITHSSSPFEIGRLRSDSYNFDGLVDELRVSNIARPPEEIAENYRMGRDHRISRTISPNDLTNKSKFPFYVAGDRPGTYAEATVGESAYANYEPDASTVGLWHLEEQTGSGTQFRDSSNFGSNGTPTGTVSAQGKIGKARNFNGGSDKVQTSIPLLTGTGDFAVSAWINRSSAGTTDFIAGNYGTGSCTGGLNFYVGSDNILKIYLNGYVAGTATINANNWYHVVATRSSGVVKIYLNGNLEATGSNSTSIGGSCNWSVGNGPNYTSDAFGGLIDEVRVDNVFRSPQEIRQAYEAEKRTHTITVDFGASLSSGNLIADGNDTSFTVDATAKGFQNKGENLYTGDKVIVKENINGIEHLAQGSVTSVNNSTGAVIVGSWDGNSTFPASGYTQDAIVFKWQREYMDLTGIMQGAGSGDAQNQKDATARITLRQTDGSEGRILYLDDFESVSSYLTDPAAANNITSTPNRYLQYRTILTSSDLRITPAVSSVTLLTDSPEINSINPNVGNKTQQLTGVTISGANFNSSTVKLTKTGQSDITCSNPTVTATQITCDLDLRDQAVGSWNVVVTNLSDGQTATLANGFTIVDALAVSSINPAFGPQAGGTDVTITGTSFTAGYKTAIDISNSSGSTLTDYQVSLTLNTASLISQNKMKQDGRDIRFLDSNKVDNLSYWIEPNTINTAATKIWVKIPNLPTSGKTIYLTYGNSTLASQSSVENTFIGEIDSGSLRGSWPMDETSGVNVADSSGNNNNGTATGTTIVDGKFEKARSFNGSSDYVSVPSGVSLKSLSQATFSLWFKANNWSNTAYDNVLYSEGLSGNSWRFGISVKDSSNLTFWTRDTSSGDSGTGEELLFSKPTTGTWHHLVAVYDSTGSKKRIYVDGQLIAETTTSVNSFTSTNPAALYIGRDAVNTHAFNGAIDEVRIFNKALSQGEIINLYNNYGFSTATYPGKVLIRKKVSSEPVTAVGTEQALVSFGGISAANISVSSGTSISVVAPAHAVGAVDVVVTSPDGQQVTLPGAYTYVPDRYRFLNSPLNLRENEAGSLTLEAQDASGNAIAVPIDITIDLDSTSSFGFFARNIEEDPTTRWNYTSVIIPAGFSSATFYYKDGQKGLPVITVSSPATHGSGGDTQQETITSRYRFLVTGITDPVKAGIPSSVTMQAIDYTGTPLHDYVGTVHFSSTDNGAILPPDFTFTQNMLGEHTFVNGVTMVTEGEWCVSATDTSDPNITGQQCNITVGAPNSGTISQLKIITSPQTFGVDSHSSAITVQTQDADGNAIPVSSDIPIYVYSDSATGQFSLDGETGWSGSQPYVITIYRNSTSASFYYRDSTLGGHLVTVREDEGTGPNTGWTNDSQTETTVSGSAYKLKLNAPSGQLVSGQVSEAFTVALMDNQGNVITALNNRSIYLRTSSSGSLFSHYTDQEDWVSMLPTFIPAGSSIITFYYKPYWSGAHTIGVSDNNPPDGDIGLLDDNLQVSVAAGPISKFAFTTAPFQITVGAISGKITLQSQDEFGNPTQVMADTNVYLSAGSPGALFSTSPSFSSTVNSIVIPAGNSSVDFYFKQTTNISSQTITASDNPVAPDGDAGIADASQTENIIPGSPAKLAITNSSPIAAIAGQESGPLHVVLQNQYGVEIPATGNVNLYFYTNSAGALKEFSLESGGAWNPVTVTTLLSGSSSLDFYYKDSKAGTTTITVSDDAIEGVDNNLTNAQVQFNISAQSESALRITSAPQTLSAGQVSAPITVRLEDIYQNPVLAGSNKTISLTTSAAGSGRFDTSAGGAFNGTVTSVVIPAGQSNVSFYYKDTAVGNPQITAQASGLSDAVQTETIDWGNVTRFGLSIADSNLFAGTPSGEIMLKTYNQYNVNVPASSDLAANLGSTNPSTGRFDVASSGAFDGSITGVTVLSGQNSAAFYYKDTKAGSATLTASKSGYTSGTLNISVGASSANKLAIITSPQSLELGQKSAVITTQLQDFYGNVVSASVSTSLYLSTSSASGHFENAASQTITSVTINSGSSSASFYYRDTATGSPVIKTSDYPAPDDSPDQGLANATQTETIIYGLPKKFSLSCSDNALTAGQPSGVITLSALNNYNQVVPVTVDLSVNLSSSSGAGSFDTDPNGSFALTSVTILSGQSSADFYYKDTAAGSPQITASKSGYTSGTYTFNVGAAGTYRMVFTNPARTTAAGNSSAAFNIQFRDQYGNVSMLSSPVTVNLATSETGGTGAFATGTGGPWTISSVTANTGATTAAFYYKDTKTGIKEISVSASGLVGDSQNTTITSAAVTRIGFTTSPQTIVGQNPSAAITVQAYDAYDNAAAFSTATSLLLSTDSSHAEFSLSSSSWSPITSHLVPAGQGTLTFYYKDWNIGNATITVHDQNNTYPSITQGVTVISGSAAKFLFQSSPQTIVKNTPSQPFTFFIADSSGNQTTSDVSITAALSSTSAGGEFSLDGISSWNTSLDIVINPGESVKNFYYRDSQEGTATVQVSNPGLTSAIQDVAVVAGEISKITLESQDSVGAGVPLLISVRTETAGGLPVSVAQNTVIDLQKSTSAGSFSLQTSPWNSVTSATIPAGQYQTAVYFKSTLTGPVTVSADEHISQGWTSGAKDIMVTVGAFYKFGFITKPSTVVADEVSSVFSVQMQDEYGNAVIAATDTAGYLYTTSSGQFAETSTGPWGVSLVTILTGQSTAQFYYKDSMPQTVTVTVSDQSPLDSPDSGILNAAASVVVSGQTPQKLVFISSPQAIAAGNWSEAITVQAQKNDGSPTILGSPINVTLGSAPSGPATFSLTQGGSSITYATIPAGATSVTIYYRNTKSDTYTLSGQSAGLTSASQLIDVIAAGPVSLAFLSTQQTKTAGFESDQMRVQLRDQYANAATSDHNLTLSLSSNSPFGEFSVQNGSNWSATNSIILSAGSSDVYFYYKDTLSGAATLTVNESPDEGITAATQQYTVSSGSVYSIGFTTNPQTLVAGQASSVMTVSLYDVYGNVAVASPSLRLYLYSSQASGSFSLQSNFSQTVQYVDISGGQSSKSFYYKDMVSGNPTIFVSDQSTLDNPVDIGITNAEQIETISWGSVNSIAFTNSASSLVAGQTKNLTLALKNQYDVVIPAPSNTNIYLHSSHSNGKFSLTGSFEPGDLITSFVLSAGANSQAVYYTDTTSGSVTLTASDISSPPESPDVGITNGTQIFSVISADLYQLAFTTSAQSLEVGQPSAVMRVEARDVFGNVKVVSADIPVYLYSSQASGIFSKTSSFALGDIVTSSQITAGSSAVTFYYKDTMTGNPIITVSDTSPLDNPDTGIHNATQTETIATGNISKLAFSSSQLGSVIAGGISSPITVYAQNQYGVEIPVLADTTVYLFSSSGSGAFSGSAGGPWTGNTVTIPNGQFQAQFYYRDGNTGTPTITASDTNQSSPDTGWTNATGSITINPGDITQIKITSLPQTITARHPSTPITIETQNMYGNPTPVSSNKNIYLRSTSSSYEFAASSSGPWGISYVTIPTGSYSATAFYHDDVIGTPTITAADSLPLTPDTGWTNAIQQETIIIQVLDHFLVTNISDPQIQGNPSSVVVMAQDSENYVVDWYTGTIHFTSSDADAVIPGDYTFVPSDHGIHTFGNGVAFLHSGEKTVTVTDTQGITGTQYDITVIDNNAGPIKKLAFIDITPPLAVNRNTVSQQLTLQTRDMDDQPSNAPEGGFAVRLTSSSPTGEFATNPSGTWSSVGLFTVPAYLNSINLFYRDSTGGAFIITGSDWQGGVDDASIQNATLNVQVKSLNITVATDLQVNNNAHYYIENPIIFAKNDTGAYRAKATFSLGITDELSGLPRNANLTFTWRDLQGNIISTDTANNVSTYNYTIIPIDGFAGEGNYTFEIQAVDVINGITGIKTINVPVSGWTIKVFYNADNRIIGEPLPFTAETRFNGALADPDNFSVNFRDNNGDDVTGSQYHREKSDLTKVGPGQYNGIIETAGLIAGDAYYLYARAYNVSNNSTLAEDNHFDIFFQNNPTLAPKNFTIEKILTSTPPAAETYNLKFTWDESTGVTKYNLYRSRNKFATLFADPCSFDQIKFNNRYGVPGATPPFCETTIQQNVGTDDATQWVLMAAINAPASSHTIPWSEVQSDLPNSNYFYLLRAENNAGESGYSTMTFSLRKGIEANVFPKSNVNWISLPYFDGNYTNNSFVAQKLLKASDVVKDIEGSTGDGSNVKINRIALWSAINQNAGLAYYYSTVSHFWIGTDFNIAPGDGIFIQASANTANYTWTAVGSDDEIGRAYSYNTPPKSSVYWVSVPYSTKFSKASEIVLYLEGALVGSVGDDKNVRINRVALWSAANQNATFTYYYSMVSHSWIGTDFSIAPGDGIFIQLSGNTSTFNLKMPLLLNPYD